MTTNMSLHSNAVASMASRPRVRGKSLWIGEQKFLVKGVTYGTFHADENGAEFHDREKVDQDFKAMARHGINSVRVYTPPPGWLLDIATAHGLHVMVGLPWEQHVTFLQNSKRAADIVERVRQGVRSCAGHSAVLAYAIGNEIPASIVRWHGPKAIEGFLRRLYEAAKAEDPDGLVTYVNFPTTEYLKLPFVDLNCFNVYLETPESLAVYLARLQNLGGEKPLLMAEVGLDSQRNGESKQADTMRWQIRTTFEAGCSGTFVFAWTDEWHRGGFDIDDWDFGLTDRERNPKPALSAVADAFAAAPFPEATGWPKISVVVCSFNGSRTIGETLEHLTKLNYPDYEVIVVNDGSTDSTEEIARRYEDIHLITVPNGGLSRARNLGMNAAIGQIVAYIDDDAYPDPDWLRYLAHTFLSNDFAGVGGPNLPPPEDGEIADCVAAAPGGPAHVLLTDKVAEHIPGCNMAFRRDNLREIGGFDPRFRVAGDDVDVCWRLQARGWQLGFHPSAVVWHHRRPSIRTYWKQQKGYGKAEALLKEKWPEKYNAPGHLSWSGRVYGAVTVPFIGAVSRVYHGVWGSAAFQSLYEVAPGSWSSVPLMPEWFLVLALLFTVGSFGLLWPPTLAAWGLFAAGVGLSVAQSLKNGFSKREFRFKQRLLTSFLHGTQPLARLAGRLRYGIVPWNLRGAESFAAPVPREVTVWSTEWREQTEWLEMIERQLRGKGAITYRGGPYDRWDLKVQSGLAGGTEMTLAVEEHGAGRQFLRIRLRPYCVRGFGFLTAAVTSSTAAAAWDGAPLAAVLGLGTIAAALFARIVVEAGCARAGAVGTVRAFDESNSGREVIGREQPQDLVSQPSTSSIAE
jgi:GT2 family glycosyltransferase